MFRVFECRFAFYVFAWYHVNCVCSLVTVISISSRSVAGTKSVWITCVYYWNVGTLIYESAVSSNVNCLLNSSDLITILPGRSMPYSDSWSSFPHCSSSAVPHSFAPKDSAVTRNPRLRGDYRERRYFRCIYCEYQSKYSSNVYKHMRRIHKHMPFFKPDRLQ